MLLLLIPYTLSAQEKGNAIVKGKVYDESNSPIGSATVTLHLLADSSIVKIDVSDHDGLFQLAQLGPSTYFLRISSIGFTPFESQAFDVPKSSIHDFNPILQQKAEELGAVAVSSTKALVVIQPDRTVINVDQLLSGQSGSALDLLEQSPGLSMNNEGVISIRGKQNILVLIDGRQTFMTGTELTEYLRGLSASLLDQIEIITQPSAKYDAMGAGGIVNLKTKKGQQQGFNANISMGAQQRKYFNSNNSLNMNWRAGSFNVTTSYGYVINSPTADLFQQNIFKNATGASEAIVEQNFQSISTNHTHDVRAGIDYDASDKTTIGISYMGTFKVYPPQSNTSFINIFDAQYLPNATNNAIRDRKASNPKQGINFYLHQKIGKNGKELSITADYLDYNRNLLYNLVNTYTDLNDPVKGQISQIRQEIPSDINIYGFKADYTFPLSETTKFEAGIKSTFLKMNNNALFQIYNESTQSFETDAIRSVHYLFDEDVSAAYLTYHQQFSDTWTLQAGLRAERTNNNGEEIITSEKFNRKHTQFFPNFMLSHDINDKHTVAVSYGRRINRPPYEQLIPFASYTDLLYYVVGNPRLRPELAHNIDISHKLANKLITTLNYSHLNDVQSGILNTQLGSLVLEESYTNASLLNTYGLSVDYSHEVASWYSFSISTTVTNRHFKGAFVDEEVNVKKTSWTTQLINQFSLGKTWKAELTGNYQSASQEDPISILHGMGATNLTLGKQILDKKGNLRILFIDPFNTGRYSYYSQQGILTSNYKYYWDNQKFGLSVSYRFGSSKVKPSREKTSSMEEETERL